MAHKNWTSLELVPKMCANGAQKNWIIENDLFVQLLKLYRNSSENTPREDFTANFISSDRQYQKTTNWFIQHMETFRKFKEVTPELEW